ncbi:MAG: TonB-dependent receptor, partial [Pyrinomonadaceae bacterium]|nr:TonB-dependent receptor [Pyrinomonadaceae bacterium]
SGEGQNLNAVQERHFAVPTVEQRGLFGLGVDGLAQCVGSNARIVNGVCRTGPGNGVATNYSRGFPTSVGGDAVFSLFPFANDPTGVYGRNTYTQALSADARGRLFSGKIDYNFPLFNQQTQTFTARYNYTDDRRDLTDVGGALFSSIRPKVRTDNFSTFLSGGLTNTISNELRFSFGRTRLEFEELRDTTGFILPVSSSRISNAADRRFLLNARTLENITLRSAANCNTVICSSPGQANFRFTGGNTENSVLGPVGQLIIAGFSPVGVDVFNFPQERTNDTIQIADTVRWQIANHSLSVGTDIRRTSLNSDLPRNSRPLVTFNGGGRIIPNSTSPGIATSLDFAAAGAATGFFQSLVAPGKNASIKLGYYQLNFFAQDEYRVLRNLSFNFGLRYEYNTTPKEADRKIEDTFGQSLPSFLSGLSSYINGRKEIYESDKNNFAARFGFAYAPVSSTVIRGGFGMYYDQIIGAVVGQSRNVYPTFTTVNFGGGVLVDNRGRLSLFNPQNAVFDPALGFVCNPTPLLISLTPPCSPTGSIPLIQPGTLNTINPALTQQQLQLALRDIFTLFPSGDRSGSSFGATLPTRNLNTPLSYHYSIGVEQELFQNLLLSAAYVGTAGRSLLRFTTPNLGSNYVATITNAQIESPGLQVTCPGGCVPTIFGNTSDPGLASRRPVANVGAINQFETTGRSRYDSLQIGLRGRFLRDKLQYQANYVYGKVEDDVSDVFDLAGASALPQNSINFAGEYAPANFDVRHRFTYNFVYDLPRLRNQNDYVEGLFGGWQVSGTGKYNTGQPFTVNSIVDVNLDGNLTDRLNSTQFITQTNDRRQPLVLTSNANLRAMLAAFGQDGAVPRNSFRAGSLLEMDVSFVKRFRFTENQNLQFRVDVFNFINRANFGIPVRFLESPGFGRAADTITPGRRVQLALKYSF